MTVTAAGTTATVLLCESLRLSVNREGRGRLPMHMQPPHGMVAWVPARKWVDIGMV